MYHIAPSKCVWALTAQASKIVCGHLHRECASMVQQFQCNCPLSTYELKGTCYYICCFAHALACCMATQYLRMWCQPHGFVLASYFICCEIKLGEGLRVSYDRPVCTKLCAGIMIVATLHTSCNIELKCDCVKILQCRSGSFSLNLTHHI